MRILFITSTRVGDAILSTGLLDHLIRIHPGARVWVACGPAAATLFEAAPGIERIVVLNKMIASLHWLELWAACVGRVWDVVVDLRLSVIPYLLIAHRRRRLARVRTPAHRVEQLAEVLELAASPPAPRLWIAERHRRVAAELIPDGRSVLAVGPAANWPAKTWRAERFTQLIDRLTGAGGILPGARVAVFGRDDERPAALGVIEAIPEDRRIDLVGRLDLLEAFACLERCAFYVGNDSGLMHLAAATAIPTLGLFGPSPEVHYAPWGPHGAVARTAETYETIFPAEFNHLATGTLMDGLSVDAAEAAARELWARTMRGDAGKCRAQVAPRP